MITRRALVGSVAVALALVFILTPSAPQAQGRGAPPPVQGGLLALQTRVQALEQALADLRTDLGELSTEVRDRLDELEGLMTAINSDLSTAEGNITTLQDKVTDLEEALGDGLTSYDALAGLPCTPAEGTQGAVHLVGPGKTPYCARTAAEGRFHDLGLVVLDTQTNLMWEKKTTAVGSGGSASDLHDVDNTYNWCVATGNSNEFGDCFGNATSWIGQVNAEVFAGFSNWRVPTRDELQGICSAGAPCINPIFGPTQVGLGLTQVGGFVGLYWSSTEFDEVAGGVFAVHFHAGVVVIDFKDNENHVRAVRAGQ